MRKTVKFHFDFLSPYAYFAALDLPELCERYDAELSYHPVLFAGLLNHWGQLGPAEIPPKAMHTFRAKVSISEVWTLWPNASTGPASMVPPW